MNTVGLDQLNQFATSKSEPSYCFNRKYSAELPTLVIAGAVHGNEPVGVNIIFKKLLELKEHRPKLNYKFVVGNPRAYAENKRFTQTDLNRSFILEKPASYEEKRAKEILDFIKDGDALIDFHQTQAPTKSPFIIFNYTSPNFNFAKRISQSLPIVTYKTSGFSGKGKGLSSAFSSFGSPSITAELGSKGLDLAQIQLGLDIIQQAENYLLNPLASPCISEIFTFSETILNEKKELYLIDGLESFSHISKGQLLYYNKKLGKSYRAQNDGIILFPKYGINAETSVELVRILKQISESDL